MKPALPLILIPALAISSALLAGCVNSNPDLAQSGFSDDRHETPTGTRIPRRDSGGVRTINKDEMERATQQLDSNNAGK